MQNILAFLLEVSRLKTTPRSGWVWLGVKKPETIAEHCFRTVFYAWLVGVKTGLNVSRMMEMALFHELCEVYAGDLTPYHGILPQDAQKRKETLKRWVRLPQKTKKSLTKKKFLIEKRALLKLIHPLGLETKRVMSSLWFEYEGVLTREGSFVKQVDKNEAMIQAIEYFGTGPNTAMTGWWEEAEEFIDHPVLLEFLEAIKKEFYEHRRSKLGHMLRFLLAVGKLKGMPQRGWVIRNVKQPDSMANHAFFLAVMSWVLSKKRGLLLDRERLLKLSLCHVLPCIYLRERTPYDAVLRKAKSSREQQEILKKWIRYPLREKRKAFFVTFREEENAMKKLLLELKQEKRLREEIMDCWEDFRLRRTKEAQFVGQVYVLELLLQALQYWKEDKKFPIEPWWEWAFESSHSEVNTEFMEELKHAFY